MKLLRLLSFLLIAAFTLPLSAQRTVIEHHNTKGSYSKSSFFKEFEIEYEGEIEIGPNDRSITAMAPGAFLKMSKSAFGSSRKVRVEADENGKISRQYYIGWRKQEFSPEGRYWLREMLPEIVRTTAVGARSRINRFYTQAGVDGVLDEVPLLQGNYLQATYLELLLEKNLSAQELIQVLESAKSLISSDFYLRQFLEENMERFTQNATLLTSFIEAGNAIGSDFYQSGLLTEAVKNQNLSKTVVAKMLVTMGPQVSSDHYLSQTLSEALVSRSFTASQQEELLKLTRYISSDHYQSQLLITVLKENHFANAAMQPLIKSLEGISSDHYYTQVISRLKDKPLSDENLRRLLTQMGQQVSSDHYLTQSLSYLIEGQDFPDPVFKVLVNTVESINSDHYTHQVVLEVARALHPSAQSLQLFLQSLSTHVSSDYYLSECLSELAPLVKVAGPQAREAYLKAANSIQSDTYLGKATRALR